MSHCDFSIFAHEKETDNKIKIVLSQFEGDLVQIPTFISFCW